MDQNGNQEGRNVISKSQGVVTFDDVKQAWESPDSRKVGAKYLVKDISSSCYPGIVLQ